MLATLLLSACAQLIGPKSDVQNGTRSPTDLANEMANAAPPSGSSLVDVLASSFKLDKTSATANGIDAITLTILLRTPSDTPAANVPITIALSGTSNVVEPALVVSDTEGSVTVTLQSTRAETKKLSVRVQQGALGASTVSFVAGPVDALRSSLTVSPNHQRASGTDASVITVHLRDAADNPVRLEPIAFAISGSNNTAQLGSSPFSTGLVSGATNDAGDFVVQLRSTTAESKRLVATAQNTPIRGMVRFVNDWFLAAGAPYGDRFDCVAVEGEAGDRRWFSHTLHGTFASEASEFEHRSAARLAPDCIALATDQGTLYAAFSDGQARVLDTGDWSNLGDARPGMRAIFVDQRQTPSQLWLATSSNIFRLTGTTWQAAGVSGATGAHGFASDGNTLFVAANDGVYSRDTVATTWTSLNGPSAETLALAVAVEGSTHTLYAATADQGIWQREIGPSGVWTQVSAGLPNVAYSSIVVDSSSTPARIFVATDELVGSPTAIPRSRLYSKLSDATMWTLVDAQPAGEGERIHRLFVADGLHAAVQKRGIVKLNPTLGTSARLGAALPGYAITALAHDATKDRLFALTSAGVYRSDNFGERWQQLSFGEDEIPAAMAVDNERSPSRLVVSSDAASTPHLYESQDGGDTFSDITGTLSSQASVAMASAAYAYSSRTLMVSDASQLLVRTQTPGTYAEIALQTPPFPAGPTTILRLDALGDAVFLGTDGGVFSRVLSGAIARVGGAAFTRAVRQTAKQQDGTLWFATDLGLYRLPPATSDAVRIDSTAAWSFGAVASDAMRVVTFATTDTSVYRMNADLVPLAEAFVPLASPRALSVVTKLGSVAPPLVLVGCDEAAGLYASIYD